MYVLRKNYKFVCVCVCVKHAAKFFLIIPQMNVFLNLSMLQFLLYCLIKN